MSNTSIAEAKTSSTTTLVHQLSQRSSSQDSDWDNISQQSYDSKISMSSNAEYYDDDDDDDDNQYNDEEEEESMYQDDLHGARSLKKSRCGPQGTKFLEDNVALFEFMDYCVNEFMEFTGESYSVALFLLRKFEWDQSKACSAYLSFDNQMTESQVEFDILKKKMIEEVHGVSTIPVELKISTKTNEPCEVCCEEPSTLNPCISLGCDHFFCISCYHRCWANEVVTNSSSTSRPNPFNLKCMQSDKCKQRATPEVARKVFQMFMRANNEMPPPNMVSTPNSAVPQSSHYSNSTPPITPLNSTPSATPPLSRYKN